MKEYYKIRGWDENGIPTKEKLSKLGLDKYGIDIKYISAPKYSVEIVSDNPKVAQKELIKQLTEATSKLKDGEASFEIMEEK